MNFNKKLYLPIACNHDPPNILNALQLVARLNSIFTCSESLGRNWLKQAQQFRAPTSVKIVKISQNNDFPKKRPKSQFPARFSAFALILNFSKAAPSVHSVLPRVATYAKFIALKDRIDVTRLPNTPLTELTAMYPKRIRPFSYTIAVWLLGLMIFIEICMWITVFWFRSVIVTVNTTSLPRSAKSNYADVGTPQPIVSPLPGTSINSDTPISPVPPVVNKVPDLPRPPALPGLNPNLIRPGLLDQTLLNGRDQIASYLSLAEDLLHKNQPQPALDNLLKAEALDPQAPDTLSALASYYDVLTDQPHARIYWQRIKDLGPDVGSLYATASDHVRFLSSTRESSPLHIPSTLPRAIYIDEVTKRKTISPSGQPQFNLNTILTRKDATQPFEQKKLKPYVIFYQKMPDGSLKPDLSQRNGAFEHTILFWQNKIRFEAFSVDYTYPIPGVPGPDNQPVGDYYGFIIGIYYDSNLQDVRSEPATLITSQPDVLPLQIDN